MFTKPGGMMGSEPEGQIQDFIIIFSTLSVCLFFYVFVCLLGCLCVCLYYIKNKCADYYNIWWKDVR